MEKMSQRYVNKKGVNEGRIVLHSDLNNFFASVECKKRPELSGFPVAVCGSKEDRHGIVLAKNELAKKCGVKTAEPIWQAKNKCADLIIVKPDYDEYVRYSVLVKEIYSRYSELVEGFGMDEAWIELTGDIKIKTLSDGAEVADRIRKEVKRKTGLTVSVGVSDNKIFSKLASDFKKPDAVTVFGPENYDSIIRKINIEDLVFVGRSTKARLNSFGIRTIGDVADTNPVFLQSMLGKNGETLFYDASGANSLRVKKIGYIDEAKSVGNSTTLAFDLESIDEVKDVFFALAEKVAFRLRSSGAVAKTVCISVRGTNLSSAEKQMPIEPTGNALEIARAAIELYRRNYDVNIPVRALGIRTTNLVNKDYAFQINMFDEKYFYRERLSVIDYTMDKIRKKYGACAITHLSAMKNSIDFHSATSFAID